MINDEGIIQGEDFEMTADGRVKMTSAYLKKRGRCCQSGCSNCPYGFTKDPNIDPNIPSEFRDPWSPNPSEQIEFPFDELD